MVTGGGPSGVKYIRGRQTYKGPPVDSASFLFFVNRVLDLENTKTTQALEINSLKIRVKKLGRSKEDASKHKRIADIDANKDIYFVNFHTNEDMFDVNDLDGDEVIVKSVDVVDQAKEVVVDKETIDDITLAKALMEIKSAKPKADNTRPKAKGLVIHEQEQAPTPTVSLQQPSQVKVQDKGKGKMVELEPVKKQPKKDQLMLDKKLAFKLQAKEEEEEEEEMITREKAQQIKERAEEKRNKPPTLAQQMSIMCTYLKNIDRWKTKSLKNKSFTDIQELFNKAIKKVNTFVDYRAELVEESSKKAKAEVTEGSLKRAVEELEQGNAKKQKMEDDKELKWCLKIIQDDRDDVTIDATPLSFKSPTIVNYKIHKKGKKIYF
uniref:Uncharacterized protein n=1 Tax=Tanacetum cinerariifolium TaxID=118510 RepID=A0A6L2M3I9_TANCI|nr:hypothetical protein [Tanacetum cinerariifolium]